MSTVVLLDGNNFGFRSFSTAELSFEGQRTEMVYLGLRQLMYYIKRFDPVGLVSVWDGAYDERRLSVFPEYKQKNREVVAKADPVERQAFLDQRAKLKELMHLFGITQVRCPQREADDVIATLAKAPEILFPKLKEKPDAVIVSTDRDYYQLVSPRVTVYSPSKAIIKDEAYIREEMSIEPKDYPFWKAIVGGHDGIPGLMRIGPRGAAFLLQHLKSGLQPDKKWQETALTKFLAEREDVKKFTELSSFMDVPVIEILENIWYQPIISEKQWQQEAYDALKALGFANYYQYGFAEFTNLFLDYSERVKSVLGE